MLLVGKIFKVNNKSMALAVLNMFSVDIQAQQNDANDIVLIPFILTLGRFSLSIFVIFDLAKSSRNAKSKIICEKISD